MGSRIWKGVVLGAAILVVTACGGSGAGAGDPAGVVQAAMAAAASKDLAALEGYACAAQKDQIAEQFDFSSALGDLGEDIDQEQILEAITIDASKVTVGQATVNGDAATVPVGGSMSIDIDTEKLKPIMKQVLEAQGVTADDAMVEQAIAMMGAFSGQDIPMDETLTLVKEDGAWKLCE